MSTGLDVASGIAGLASLAIAVSKAIAQFALDVKNYPRYVQELQAELDLLGNVVSGLNDFILDEQSKGRVFEDDSVLWGAVSECKRRIEKIGDSLRTSRTGKLGRALNRLEWPYKQKDVLSMMDNLRQYRETFQFAMTVRNNTFISQSWDDARRSLEDQRKKLDELCKTTSEFGAPIDALLEKSQELQKLVDVIPSLLSNSEDLRELKQSAQMNERRDQERRTAEILDWLAPLSSLQKHVKVQQHQNPNTCKWLLQDGAFVNWAAAPVVRHDILCQGRPGVGKTVLCSLVADHLRAIHSNENVAVAHFYFDFAEQQTQADDTLARAVLRQLCLGSSSIPTAVAEFYSSTRNNLPDSAWFKELQDIIRRVAATFDQCFIVIDAFDEINATKRNAVLKILDSFRLSAGVIKYFITSRPHVLLEQLPQFRTAKTYNARASEDDLHHFLDQRIDAHHHSAGLVDVALKREILDRLCANADGVFLLPALQIDQILDDATCAADIDRALDNLSTDLKEVFKSTIARIEGFEDTKQRLAFGTLMWVSHARRPLNITELQHALAARSANGDVSSRDISPQFMIIESCCGLVEVDHQSQIVRFVHGSITEYLRNIDHGFFKKAELEIVRVCLKYMKIDNPKEISFKSRSEFARSMKQFPFMEYASLFWGFHAREVKVQDYQDLALEFMSSSSHLYLNARVKDVKTPEFRRLNDKLIWVRDIERPNDAQRKFTERMLSWCFSGGAGISLAASFGLADLTKLLIDQSSDPVLDARNMHGSTPLHEAAIFGYKDVAELLVTHGANLLDLNRGMATPFYLAVSYKQLEMCHILLKYGNDQLNIRCKQGNTALHKATELGDELMVEFLLQSGAHVEAQNERGETPLHLGAQNGHLAIVRMLVLRGANPQPNDHGLLTPLDMAALVGHTEVVEYLIQQSVDVNHVSRENWTALCRAASSGKEKTVRLLLANGASIVRPGQRKLSPFHIAVKSGSLGTVQAILNHNPQLTRSLIQQKDYRGDTASKIAFYTAHNDIYEYLRDREADFPPTADNITPDPLLPLNRLIEQGLVSQVKEVLRSIPAWLTAKDHLDQTPLHTAFRTQQFEIADYILLQGISINSEGHHGWTPIHIAAQVGSLRMTELALDWNADIHKLSASLQSPLHKAASARSNSVIEVLLQQGCSTLAVNDRGMTPIHVAARRNYLEGIQLMTQPKYGGRELLLRKDMHGRTARDWATRSGHLELAAILRDEERHIKHHVHRVDSHGNVKLAGAGNPRRRGSNNPFLSPPHNRTFSRESTFSLTSTEDSTNSLHNSVVSFGYSLSPSPSFSPSLSPSPSPVPSPRMTSTASTPAAGTPTPAQDASMRDLEETYNGLGLSHTTD